MTIQKDIEGNEKKYLHDFADFSRKRVLEIGCGEGRLTWQYAHASSLTIGLDSDHDALRVASMLIDSGHPALRPAGQQSCSKSLPAILSN